MTENWDPNIKEKAKKITKCDYDGKDIHLKSSHNIKSELFVLVVSEKRTFVH